MGKTWRHQLDFAWDAGDLWSAWKTGDGPGFCLEPNGTLGQAPAHGHGHFSQTSKKTGGLGSVDMKYFSLALSPQWPPFAFTFFPDTLKQKQFPRWKMKTQNRTLFSPFIPIPAPHPPAQQPEYSQEHFICTKLIRKQNIYI